jgi:hypothetical protein
MSSFSTVGRNAFGIFDLESYLFSIRSCSDVTFLSQVLPSGIKFDSAKII